MKLHVGLAVVVLGIITVLTLGCGGSSSPTRTSMIPEPSAVAADPANAVISGFSGSRVVAGPTVAEILASPNAFIGQQVELTGRPAQAAGPRSFLFTDGTGVIPADFPTDPLPTLSQTIAISATVVTGIGDFAARLTVSTWAVPPSFNSDDLLEVRARFSDPGFVAGNVVGYFLSYQGVPPGNKMLEVHWDENNPSGAVDRIELGEGRPRGDGLFDLTGVVGHEYPDVVLTVTKTVRANLLIENREGRCSRVRDVTVTRGAGPGFAAGGNLTLRFNDPVPSGGFFSVTARVSNPTASTPFDARLFFSGPDGSTIRTLGAGCERIDDDDAACLIKDIAGSGFGEAFVQYFVPEVDEPTVIRGSVTLIGRDFQPVAAYSTTVEPR